MGEGDILQRQILKNPAIFADACGLKLREFGLKVDPDDLEIAYPFSSTLDENGKNRELIGDMRMYWKSEDAVIALLGIESQSYVDRTMVARIMRYDAERYLELLNDNPFCGPVITIVLYIGKTPWNGPKMLRDNIRFSKEEEKGLRRMFSNYKIHIVDFHDVTLTEIKPMPSDFRFYATLHYNLLHPKRTVALPAVKDTSLAKRYLNFYGDGRNSINISEEQLAHGGYKMNELLSDYIAYEQGVALDKKYKQGVKHGVEQERRATALRMASRGVAIEDIADFLRVDQATVETLLRQNS